MIRWIAIGLGVAVLLLAPVLTIAGALTVFSGGGTGNLARINSTGAVGLAAAARQAGFHGQALRLAVAVGLAESGGNPTARNPNPPTPGCPTGSLDRGGWQLNDCYHAEVPDACAYQLACAAHETYRISTGGANWTPWVTFTSGAWRAQLAVADRAIAANSGLLKALRRPEDAFAELALLAHAGDGSGDEVLQGRILQVVEAAQLHVPVHLAAALQQPSRVGQLGAAVEAHSQIVPAGREHKHQALVARADPNADVFAVDRHDRVRKRRGGQLVGAAGQRLNRGLVVAQQVDGLFVHVSSSRPSASGEPANHRSRWQIAVQAPYTDKLNIVQRESPAMHDQIDRLQRRMRDLADNRLTTVDGDTQPAAVTNPAITVRELEQVADRLPPAHSRRNRSTEPSRPPPSERQAIQREVGLEKQQRVPTITPPAIRPGATTFAIFQPSARTCPASP